MSGKTKIILQSRQERCLVAPANKQNKQNPERVPIPKISSSRGDEITSFSFGSGIESIKHQLSKEERWQTACKELSSLITLALVTKDHEGA